MALDPQSIILGANAILLFICFILVGVLIRLGVLYNVHYGDSSLQEPMRWKILWIIVWLIFIGLFAAVFNIVTPLIIGQ